MKGEGDVPIWTYIVIGLTLLLLVTIIPVVYQAFDAVKSNDARLEAQSVAGIINMMETSPSSEMYYKHIVPKTCAIKISKYAVNVSTGSGGAQKSYVAGIIQNKVAVEDAEIQCSQRRYIEFTKDGDRIVVA